MASNLQKGVKEISDTIFLIVIYALVIGSVLGSTAFASITIVNITYLSEQYGLAVVAIVGLFATGGTIIGVMWFIKYAKELFSKKGGMGLQA